MRHLNYGHLLYFWTVAREGSIARASEVLHITPQTISGQLRLLEDSVGNKLFTRSGRRLVLSETGRLVFRYADEIFSIGAELAEVVRGRIPGGPVSFAVGITDAVPKLVASQILDTALSMEDPPRIVCSEGTLDQLVGELAIHNLDLVISDSPVPPGLHVTAYSHRLGESGVAFVAVPKIARRLKRRFPQSLAGAPMLMPARNTPLGRALEQWFDEIEAFPTPVAEIADSALLKALAHSGAGVAPVPDAIADEVCRTYGLSRVGSTGAVLERYFAISVERRLKHPAVVAIIEAARQELFARPADAAE